MPARVSIQSGISAGTSHWIQRSVIRIGSDPNSDVCLPTATVPAHAATLEFRDGTYRIYNRCGRDIFVGTHRVSPGEAREWQEADVLHLDDEIQLALDVEDDPTPRPMRSVANLVDDFDEPLPEVADVSAAPNSVPRAKTSFSSKDLIQLAITCLCIVGCVVLVVRERRKDRTSGPELPSFTAIVRDALASERTSPQLVRRLQYAEAAFVRGDTEAASERFGELRDALVPLQAKYLQEDRMTELTILSFVESRLADLN